MHSSSLPPSYHSTATYNTTTISYRIPSPFSISNHDAYPSQTPSSLLSHRQPTRTSHKKAKILLRLPKPQPTIKLDRPASSLPLAYYLARGIVPLHPSHPDLRFSLTDPVNLSALKRHAANKEHVAALKTLIKAGRKHAKSTPGITIRAPDDQVTVRYEYWPVFDEHAGEDEWVLKWPREKMVDGKKLGAEKERELMEYFYRPAHIPETLDFC